MKRYIAGIVALLMLLLTACSNQTETPADEPNAQADRYTRLEEGVWPANAYTEGLPIPPGTVAWAVLDTEQENCSVSLEGVSEDAFSDYMNQLKQAGFTTAEYVSEEVKGQSYVSIGTLLSDSGKDLSISYIPGILTIYIRNK